MDYQIAAFKHTGLHLFHATKYLVHWLNILSLIKMFWCSKFVGMSNNTEQLIALITSTVN